LLNFLTLAPLKAADSTAQILEPKTGLKKTTLEGEHSLGLNDCCWVDERLLVTASDDNSLVLWDIEMVIEKSVLNSLRMRSYLK
jgi:WD40 repeat protein